jgi:hypothetical protein
MERDFKWIWIPKEIWLCKELNYIQKILLVEIDSLDNENWCFASNDYFSEFFWISKTQISKYISILKKEWYIKEVWFDWRQRILKSNIKLKLKSDINKSLNQPWRKVKGWIKEKLKHNNIYNNINNNNISKDILEQSSDLVIEEFWNKEINEMQDIIKNTVLSLWLCYRPWKYERWRIKNILTWKEFWEMCDLVNMNRKDFVINIIKVSTKLEFWNWKIYNAETLYKHYANIYNEARKQKQQQKTITVV